MGSKLTLTDVTKSTWSTLADPPDGTAVPSKASALCLKDTKTCMVETKDRIGNKPLFARNQDWDPRPLPKILKPISWPFLQRPLFKKSTIFKGDIFNLTFVAEPPAGYSVKVYSIKFKAGANLPPQFVAVAVPMDLDISEPPAFLVHYKHVPGQGKGSTWFKHFDPLGWDWLFFEIWGYLNFNAQRNSDGSHTVEMPFVSGQQFSFGFPYQLRQAKKPYVIVLPHISRVFDSNGKLQDYQLYSAETLRELLIEIQNDIMTDKKREKLGHVAISSNSSGCNLLSQFLMDNVAAMKGNKAIAEFMNDEFNEIFVFDPPENFGDAMIVTMEGWRKLKSSRSGSKGKCVRFYTHSFTKNMTMLAGQKASPFKQGENGFWESAGKTVSLAYLPFVKNGDDVWQRTQDEFVKNSMAVSNFAFVHHVIPALCLTDAASRSLYV